MAQAINEVASVVQAIARYLEAHHAAEIRSFGLLGNRMIGMGRQARIKDARDLRACRSR